MSSAEVLSNTLAHSAKEARSLKPAALRSLFEEARRDGAFRAGTILDALPVAIYTTDADGTITYFNQAAASLAGRQPRLGKDKWCVTWRLRRADGSILPHDECPMAQALKERRAIRGVEAFAERPDGTLVPFAPYPTPMFDTSGELVGAVNMLVDISQRKVAEATLRSAEHAAHHLAAIVESSEDAVVSKDLNGIIRTWNKGAERLFGYTAEEVIGKPVLLLIPADHQDEEPGILKRIRRGERVEHYETVRQRKDGSLVDISLTISPILDSAGRIVGASKIARDISERRRNEAALAGRMAEQVALYRFTEALHYARSLDEIYQAALDAVTAALGCDRTSILLFDAANVMRFVAWRGLSDGYRAAVEGHSPWSADSVDPRPIFINDIAGSDLAERLKATVAAEGIGAVGFVPLLGEGRLIGKFMAYYDRPHRFTEPKADLALTIARQLGFSIERKRAELQRGLLVAELSHRVKNTLATVVSIARQSFATNPDAKEAQRSFDARIRALAQTHGRLAETSWSGISLETLLDDELAPYRREDDANVSLCGPPVTLTPKQALTLGMAIHELATNAAKYGALSTKYGLVELRWELDPETKVMHIRWSESGGPVVAPPTRNGFGRLLIERVLAADLGGKVDYEFASGGVTCSIVVPLDSPAAGV